MEISIWIPVIAALVTGIIGGGWLGAIAGQWYGARQQLASDLRATRLRVYTDLWALTAVFSTWPRTDATREDAEALHREFRLWYYGTGGMHMSENARDQYGELQKLLDVALRGAPSGALDDRVYSALREQASRLRTALTEDLDTRVRRSPVARRSEERAQRRMLLESKELVKALAIQGGTDGDPAVYPAELKVAAAPVSPRTEPEKKAAD